MILEWIQGLFTKQSQRPVVFNPRFYIPVAKYMLPRPSRRYCKPILHEDNVELPIVTVTLEWFE